MEVTPVEMLNGVPHGERLLEWSEGATGAEIVVSFLFPEGVDFVAQVLRVVPVDLTISTYMRITRRAAVERLLRLLSEPSRGSRRLRVRVATADKYGLHAKIYRFSYADGTARLVVGSANLSRNGLFGRSDASLVVTGPAAEIPVVDYAAMPALLDRRWATKRDPSPLSDILAWYADRPYFGGDDNDAGSDAFTFVNCTDTSPAEEAAIEHVRSSKQRDVRKRVVGHRDADDFAFIIRASDPVRWRIAVRVQTGDLILLGDKGSKELCAYSCAGLYRGVPPPLRREAIVLFLKDMEQIVPTGPSVPWRNAALAREDLPVNLRERREE